MNSRLLAIKNPNAGTISESGDWFAVLEDGAYRVEVVEPDSAEDTVRCARRASEQGIERIVAVGGDGTMHCVVQGVGPGSSSVVGLIPCGTGNDLARGLGLPLDAVEAARVATEAPPRKSDLIGVAVGGVSPRWGVNALTIGGMHEPEVTEQAPKEGRFSYVERAVRALSQARAYDVAVTWPDLSENARIVGAIVANGRTAGGGWPISSTGELGDGFIEVAVVLEGDLPGLISALVRGVLGALDQSDLVLHRTVERFGLRPQDPLLHQMPPARLDGEALPRGPLEVFVAAGGLRLAAPTG